MFARLIILTILLVIIEFFFVPLPWVFIALFLLFHYYSNEQGLLLAFIAGLVFDILLLFPLGTIPLLFMGLLFLSTLYRRKYEATNLFFLGIMVFVSVLILEFFLTQTIAISNALFGMVVIVLMGRFFVPTWSKYESWYRVS